MAKFDYDDLVTWLVGKGDFHRSSFGSAYGEISGHPIHVGSIADANGNGHIVVIAATPSTGSAEMVKERWLSTYDDLKERQIEIEPDVVVAKVPFKAAGKLTFPEWQERVETMAAIASTTAPVRPMSPHARVGLVDGAPMYISESDVAEIERLGQEAQNEYDAFKPRVLAGVGLGLLGVLVSAFVWAALAMATEREFWLVGIGAGFLISFLTVRGMGKTNRGVQALIGAFTLGAVILGQVATIIWIMAQELGTVNIGDAFAIYGEIIGEETSILLFALGGGLFGAWYGMKFAGRPQIQPTVDIAPAA